MDSQQTQFKTKFEDTCLSLLRQEENCAQVEEQTATPLASLAEMAVQAGQQLTEKETEGNLEWEIRQLEEATKMSQGNYVPQEVRLATVEMPPQAEAQQVLQESNISAIQAVQQTEAVTLVTPPPRTVELQQLQELKTPGAEGVPQFETVEVNTTPVENMDVDEEAQRALKRCRQPETDTQGDSEEEVMPPPKQGPGNRRRIIDDEEQDESARRRYEFRERLITASGMASSSNSESEGGKGGKVGRPKKIKRSFDPEEAEKRILEKTGVAPEQIDENLLLSMTASDISAQALEYLEHIEEIRKKSGRLQGGLSGEMRKRKTCLEGLIRALQFKADSKNDPEFLKHKLGELMNEVKKHKKEEEKRGREVSELRETIDELRKENKEMREELRRVKEEVRRNSEERHMGKKGNELGTDENNITRRERGKEGPQQGKGYTSRNPSVESWDSRSRSPSIVRRPPLGGRSAVIVEGPRQSKEERMASVNRQIEALKKVREMIGRTGGGENIGVEYKNSAEEAMPPPLPQRAPRIRVLENIQLVPPKNDRMDQQKEQEWPVLAMDTDREENWKTTMSKKEKRKEKRRRKGEAPSTTASGPPLPPSTEKEGQRKGEAPNHSVAGPPLPSSIGQGKRKGEAPGQPALGPPLPSSQGKGIGKGQESRKTNREIIEKIAKKRLPKTAAVCIKGKTDDFSYAEALRKARTSISLGDLDIGAPKIRKGINGATIIEISGPDNTEKADKLVAKLQEVLEDADVTRPTIKGELRLGGLDDSVTKSEIEFAVAENGECNINEVSVSSVRPTRSGLNTAWIKCPLKAAIAISSKGKIPIGWTIVRAELLQARPTQCFKCWRVGHTIRTCKAEVDYRQCCFRCGRTGHEAKSCKNKVRCILCEQQQKNSDHRVGSVGCTGIREDVSKQELEEHKKDKENSTTRRNVDEHMDTQ